MQKKLNFCQPLWKESIIDHCPFHIMIMFLCAGILICQMTAPSASKYPPINHHHHAHPLTLYAQSVIMEPLDTVKDEATHIVG